MMVDVDAHIEKARAEMDHALEHLSKELSKIRTGKASGALFENLKVDYYGTPTPLTQIANISTSDSRTIVIQPWEKKSLAAIERSIFEANMGMTPMNDGEVVRLTIPPLTEERRKELVKQAKHLTEDTKVSIRNSRRDCMEFIKKATKDGYPEDMGKVKEKDLQELTNQFGEKAEKLEQAKEKDILTV
ncbi:MAG: ribosome recycling factor [Saprospiraceae bacterium]